MNKAGQLAERLLRLDLVILDELGYLPFSPSGGGLAITAFITNIENKRRVSRPQASPLGFATATYTPPRTYGLRLSANF